ncbi:MAG: hypothetical protein GXP09_07720 [Gammaproteobacteria bacterium]|nr:hypothetical protein [Gammaproteobacteria bacterium]
MSTPKQMAKEIIDRLPEEVSWEDILYELYVMQEIDQELAEAEATANDIPLNKVRGLDS